MTGAIVHWIDECKSTMDSVRALARPSTPGVATVLATRRQIAGRGRQGRPWQSGAPGHSLLFSVRLYPQVSAERFALVPIAMACAVASTLTRDLGARVALKWPNDLVDATGRKLAGFLAESHDLGSPRPELVVGLGVNCFQRPEDFPPELRERATSLTAVAGRLPFPTTDAVLAALLPALQEGLDWVETADDKQLELSWSTISADLGRQASVWVDGVEITGRVEGFAVSHGLLLRDAAGTLHAIRAEHVQRMRVAGSRYDS